jgi:hypothetical protein
MRHISRMVYALSIHDAKRRGKLNCILNPGFCALMEVKHPFLLGLLLVLSGPPLTKQSTGPALEIITA